jgi:hypothetical protein
VHDDGFRPGILKFCAYSGFVFVVLWPLAAGVIADGQFILPPSAATPSSDVVASYTDHITRIQIAATLLIFSSMFYTTWGMAVTMMTRKKEGDWPILFYIQLISLACCVVVVFLIGYFWAAASWRAGETDDKVTQAFNDIGWLGVLYTGAPFAVYMLALAAGTLADKSDTPVYPRWSAYLNIFVSIFMFEAAGILFFKTGPFSQNGVAVFYIPMIVFFCWIVVFAYLAVRAVNNEIAARSPAVAEVPNPAAPEGDKDAAPAPV